MCGRWSVEIDAVTHLSQRLRDHKTPSYNSPDQHQNWQPDQTKETKKLKAVDPLPHPLHSLKCVVVFWYEFQTNLQIRCTSTFFGYNSFLVIIQKETKRQNNTWSLSCQRSHHSPRKIKRKLSIIMDACFSMYPASRWSTSFVKQCVHVVMCVITVKMSHLLRVSMLVKMSRLFAVF